MATIKSYTDIEQSKKLAKILSPKSADMFYIAGKGEPIFIGNKMVAYGEDDYDCLGGPDVLCWSLSALLSVLPNTIGCYYKTLGWFDNDWHCIYMDEDGETIGDDMGADNPVDACYKTIIGLSELKIKNYGI